MKFFTKIFGFLGKHKFLSFLVIVVAIGSGYFFIQAKRGQQAEIQYSTAAVERGVLTDTVSGSGQVSASNQIDIQPKVSGDITSVNVVAGQRVKEGDLIARIDSREASIQVNEARASLENAQLDLEELLAGATESSLLQAENSLIDAEDSLTKLKTTQENSRLQNLNNQTQTEADLEKSYEDAFNTIADAFLDLPDVMSGMYEVLSSYAIADDESSIPNIPNSSALILSVAANIIQDRAAIESLVESAQDGYQLAYDDYQDSFDAYSQISRASSKQEIEELLAQTLETSKIMFDALKKISSMLDFWTEYRTRQNLEIYSAVSGYKSDLTSRISQVNSHVSSLLNAQSLIKDYRDELVDIQRDIEEAVQNDPLDLAAAERNVISKQGSLSDLKSGATELEIKSKQLVVSQKQNSLNDALQNLADYAVRAPFDGVIAAISAVRGDTAGTGTAIASLITEQKISSITFNEVDATKIQVGQSAILEFDALADLSITGKVAELDILGEVTQGVVSYNVKIVFDVQDERVKPGMSVSVDIIVNSKADALLVPLAAVKTQNGSSYVEVLVDGSPQSKAVTTGLSNDTMMEITEGLSEGDLVITQTASENSSGAKTNSAQNAGPGGFGGNMMMIR